MPGRIFITAAEVSGDLHASHLIRELRQRDPSLVIEGHGGPRMRAAGATIHYETTARAAMGASALGRVLEMRALVQRTAQMFRESPPDLQICVDSPALNFHFAKVAKTAPQKPVPVLFYVAPQLWAWREGRMKKVRKWIDRLACILPFEEAYFRAHGVNATFVGHPLLDEMHEQVSTSAGASDAATNHEAANGQIVGLLAGSRRSEAAANFPRMLEVAKAIRASIPGVRFLLPTTEATDTIVRSAMASSGLPTDAFAIERGAFDSMVPRCDLVITVSGTATLHVAVHHTPMIVVYHGSPLLWHLLGRWIIRTRTYGLVNLLAADPAAATSGRVTKDMHIVPEYIPWFGSTRPVAQHAIELLHHPEKLAQQKQALQSLTAKLGGPGASARVAEMALQMLG